jgi:hypothetical protein
MEKITERDVTAPPATHKKRRRRSRTSGASRLRRRVFGLVRWRLVFVTLVILLVFGVGFQAIRVSDAANQLQNSFGQLQRTIETISNRSGTELTLNDFERLRLSVRDVSNNMTAVESSIQPVRSIIADLNPDWAITLEALDISQELLAAVQDMLVGVEPALFYMVDGQEGETVVTQISSGERIVELLDIGRVRFNQADEHLARARTMLDAMELSGVSQDMLLQIRELEDYYDQIDEVNTVMLQAPGLLTQALGLEETQSYLILAQNSDELRPSGGYVSTYGWMTVRNGRIVDYDYFPTTTTTPDPPPEQYEIAMDVPEWWINYNQPLYAMWDGSWFASFPRTAEMARLYYNLGEDNPNTPIDGVIAIDIRGFELVLEALESVGVDRTIDGEAQLITITSDNFRDIVYDIRAFGEGVTPHKAFIADVYDAIFSEWQTTSRDPEVSQELLGILLESLLQKHIMVYSTDREINQVLDILGWSGRQAAAQDHDYLMVADANLGNKSNRSIIRQLTYDVTINPDETLDGRVTVNYDYSDAVARDDPAIDPEFHGPIDYNNLLQVFTPVGASLVEQDNLGGQPTAVDEENHTIFVSRVRVEYDTAQRFQISYTMPDLIDTVGPYNRYRLLIQKQPGVIRETVSVQISLPPDTEIISISPQPDAVFDIDNLILDFRIALEADTWFEIIYAPAN